jgi:predicted ArsR family transcriptional regulator
MTQGDDLEAVGARYGRQLAHAHLAGNASATPADVVRTVLDGLGFRPNVDIDDEGHIWITTENCPFGWVAVEATEGQVCRLDRAIVSGVLDGAGCPSSVDGHASIAGGQGTCVREAVPKAARV